MKKLFMENNVPCPQGGKFEEEIENFKNYPAFIKPNNSCASQGVELNSIAYNKEEAIQKWEELKEKFE